MLGGVFETHGAFEEERCQVLWEKEISQGRLLSDLSPRQQRPSPAHVVAISSSLVAQVKLVIIQLYYSFSFMGIDSCVITYASRKKTSPPSALTQNLKVPKVSPRRLPLAHSPRLPFDTTGLLTLTIVAEAPLA